MIKVLIVDDSFFMRKMFRAILESDSDIKVIGEANNGIDALSMIDVLNPDVVCMDIVMPGVDGLSALGNIMAHHPTPVVLVSSLSNTTSEIANSAFKMGVAGIVRKPENPEQFKEIKDELIGKIKRAKDVDKKSLENIYNNMKYETEKEVGLFPSYILAFAGFPLNRASELINIFSKIPHDAPLGIIVQTNIPQNLINAWLASIQKTTKFKVKIAENGDLIHKTRF